MVNSIAKPKKRNSKFPLTLHKTGQYCKKIRRKIYYFGKDKNRALEKYLEVASLLHSGKPSLALSSDKISLRTLCKLYLTHQDNRVTAGEIKQRQLADQNELLTKFVTAIGGNPLVSEITTLDLQNYRAKLIREKKAKNTINNHISAIKAMFNWALENEIVSPSSIPNLKAIKKLQNSKEEKPTFTPEQLRTIFTAASPQMKAMIWLGVNCGLGCTDCAELQWKHIDFENRRLHYPRGKTGVNRNLPLWEETIKALEVLPRNNERIFSTQRGNPWVRNELKVTTDGKVKAVRDYAITKEFKKLLKKVGIVTEKGEGFYTLRRTAATLTARTKDPYAVQKLLGHADLRMSMVYIQNTTEQTDEAMMTTRTFIVPETSSPISPSDNKSVQNGTE
jgi:integrase